MRNRAGGCWGGHPVPELRGRVHPPRIAPTRGTHLHACAILQRTRKRERPRASIQPSEVLLLHQELFIGESLKAGDFITRPLKLLLFVLCFQRPSDR